VGIHPKRTWVPGSMLPHRFGGDTAVHPAGNYDAAS
jgi:hypothetical protein